MPTVEGGGGHPSPERAGDRASGSWWQLKARKGTRGVSPSGVKGLHPSAPPTYGLVCSAPAAGESQREELQFPPPRGGRGVGGECSGLGQAVVARLLGLLSCPVECGQGGAAWSWPLPQMPPCRNEPRGLWPCRVSGASPVPYSRAEQPKG